MWFGHNACQAENEYLRSTWNEIYQNIMAMFFNVNKCKYY